MPVGELAGVKGSVFDLLGERILGARAGDILGVVALVSVAAGLNAWTFAGPRVYYAMARDGVFFPGAARVHPQFKTPHVSIIAQALWTSVLILTGSLDTLSNYVGFAIVLFAGIAVAAVFVLRAREPDAPRPYRRSDIRWHRRSSCSRVLPSFSTPSIAARVSSASACSSLPRAFRCTCG